MKKLLYKLTENLPCRLINNNGAPYLERYYLFGAFGVMFYLHRFVAPDPEEHLHNHPWVWGASVVLSGSYLEEVVEDLCPDSKNGCVTYFRTVRWFNRVNANHFHRVYKAKPDTWTLFFHGKRKKNVDGSLKGWGFLERKYLVGLHNVTLFRSFSSRQPNWWLSAPTGAKAGREPLA